MARFPGSILLRHPLGGLGGSLSPVLVLLLVLSSCGPSTAGRREADDRDVERDILWELRKDRRFADVRVACYQQVITLEGHVPDRAAQDEALIIVNRVFIGARIVNKLLVRPR